MAQIARRVRLFENRLKPDPLSANRKISVRVPIGEGNFIKYGVDSEVLNNGVANYSTAIVEMDDGSVKNCPVELILFIDKCVIKDIKEYT